jgi:hypothetical protein
MVHDTIAGPIVHTEEVLTDSGSCNPAGPSRCICKMARNYKPLPAPGEQGSSSAMLDGHDPESPTPIPLDTLFSNTIMSKILQSEGPRSLVRLTLTPRPVRT